MKFDLVPCPGCGGERIHSVKQRHGNAYFVCLSCGYTGKPARTRREAARLYNIGESVPSNDPSLFEIRKTMEKKTELTIRIKLEDLEVDDLLQAVQWKYATASTANIERYIRETLRVGNVSTMVKVR